MKSPKKLFLTVVVIMVAGQLSIAQETSDSALKSAIATVQKVELHGAGHVDAVKAMKVLNKASSDQIHHLFEALDSCNQISENWIRAAIQKAVADATTFPAKEIRGYYEDRSNSAKGRWLAWQLLCNQQPEFREATIAKLVTDPSMPLRAIGIAKLIKDAAAIGTDVEKMDDSSKGQKKKILTNALENARDVDQIMAIAKSLKPLGTEVNLRSHLGFIEQWNVVAGFNNKDESGFDVAYSPEESLSSPDLKQTFTINTKQVSWTNTKTEDETGVVDLNKVIAKDKGVIAYAVSIFDSPRACEAEVRIGTPNAHKIWVNGELVMSNEIYHNSNSIDKFSAPVTLKKGENQIVLKICQNEQTEPWAQDWSFQVRFCDSTGKAIE